MGGNSQSFWVVMALLPIASGVLSGRWWIAMLLGAVIGALHPMPFFLHQEAMLPTMKKVLLSPDEINDLMIRQRFGRHALGAILGGGGAVAAFYFLRPMLLKLKG